MKTTDRIKGALFGALVLIFVCAVTLAWSFRRADRATDELRQHGSLIVDVKDLLTDLIDAETGQRGYLLTGDSAFLSKYVSSDSVITERLRRLTREIVQDSSKRSLARIRPMISTKMNGLAALIALRDSSGSAPVMARLRAGESRVLMDSIRALAETVVAVELSARAGREAAMDDNFRLLLLGIVGVSVFVVLFSLASIYLVRSGKQQDRRNVVHGETSALLVAQEAISDTLRDLNETLAEGEERLAVTLDSIGDAVLTTDMHAHVLRLNPVAERLTGWTSQEAVGRPVDEVFHIINKDTRAPATIPVSEALARGVVQGLANHTVLIARDGSESDIADSCAPIRDRTGAVVGAVLVFRDVTNEYAVQQSLRDSSALIDSVLDTVTDGILTFHAKNGRVARANTAAERIFGYGVGELIGIHFGTLVPQLGTEIAALYEQVRSDSATRAILGRDMEGRRRDHSTVAVEIGMSDTMQGGERYFTASVRDITTKTVIDAALREAGALQNAIFNTKQLSSIATDTNGVIQIFSTGAEQMLGYSAADVLNAIALVDICDPLDISERAHSVSLELGAPVLPGIEALVYKASQGVEDSYELTYIRRDGGRFPVAVTVTGLRDTGGAIIGYLFIGTDETARKLVEAEQRESAQRVRDQQFYTRSLIESNTDALTTTDPTGIITDVNRQMEALTGWTRDELIGAPFRRFFTDPDRAALAVTLVLSQKLISDYELTVSARDGTTTVVSYNASTFYDRERTLQGVFATARDITERKRVEVELKNARDAAESASLTKSEFLASMSHEIRTPLNALMGTADLLASTVLTDEQDRFVQIFRRAGDNLLNLTNDILDLSKVEASQLELERTGFSVQELVAKVVDMISARLQEKGLALVTEIAPDVPSSVVGDPTRLQQVLLNLLGNAVKFTESGTISLRIANDESGTVPTALRFTVRDTGVGIAVGQLDRIFERFTQADSSTTRRFGGSGLGLTICKRLVELMGGRIWAESTLGSGSLFAFAVPLEASRASAVQISSALGSELEVPLLPLRILLAEDSADNCTIVIAYLAKTPYTVDVALNGAIALQMFIANPYDIVLMDRQMPVMDGLASARAIRSWELANQRPATPIIALTASALKGDREQCLAAGCTAFLTKPVRQDVLLAAIAERSDGLRVMSRETRIRNMAWVVPENVQIADRVPTFLQNRRHDVMVMRAALDRGELSEVRRLGHNMRGTGTSYGFQAITEIGLVIEEEADRGDHESTAHWVDVLSNYLDQVEPL